MLYEYEENSLKAEVSQRQQINLYYNQSELWYILETLLNVVQYLNIKNVHHSDLRPYNILVD
jgi:hypothetical protein